MASREKPILSVRVAPELLERLDKICEKSGCGRAEVVERCLVLGILEQEDFVEWLESSVKGPILELMMHPKVAKAIFALAGGEPDESAMKIARGVRANKKQKGLSGRVAPAL